MQKQIFSFLLSAAISIPPGLGATPQKISASLVTEFGLNTVVFNTDGGKIFVNLPEDIAPGDTLSGSVVVEASGSNIEERARSEEELKSYTVEIRKTLDPNGPVDAKGVPSKYPSTSAGATGFTCLVPATGKAIDVSLLKEGKLLSTQTIKLAPTPVALDCAEDSMLLPPVGQPGRALHIKGLCDGNFGTSHVTIGGDPCRVLAESPRGMIVQSPRDVAGSSDLAVSEGGKTAAAGYHSAVVKLSCPKTTLRKSERVIATVRVTGLENSRDAVQLKISNMTPSTVDMEGGNEQQMTVAGGAPFEKHFTIKGRDGGGFSIRALVVPSAQPVKKADAAQPNPNAATGGASRLNNLMSALRRGFTGFPLPFTGSAVSTIENDIARALSYQQQEFLTQLNASRSDLSNAQKAALLAIFLQYRRDQMIRNFERAMLQDRVLAQRLGGNGRRDLLWLIRDVLYSASLIAISTAGKSGETTPATPVPASASTGVSTPPPDMPQVAVDPEVAGITAASLSARQAPNADQLAGGFKSLLGEGTGDETSSAVMQALARSTMLEESDEVEREIDRFAKISDKLDLIALERSEPAVSAPTDQPAPSGGKAAGSGSASTDFRSDDFEQLLSLADKVDPGEAPAKKQLLEMAMEAAGRTGSSSSASDSDRKKAREFALRLTVRFHELKTRLNADDSSDQRLIKDIDYNIDKCLRITDGKDFYA